MDTAHQSLLLMLMMTASLAFPSVIAQGKIVLISCAVEQTEQGTYLVYFKRLYDGFTAYFQFCIFRNIDLGPLF